MIINVSNRGHIFAYACHLDGPSSKLDLNSLLAFVTINFFHDSMRFPTHLLELTPVAKFLNHRSE